MIDPGTAPQGAVVQKVETPDFRSTMRPGASARKILSTPFQVHESKFLPIIVFQISNNHLIDYRMLNIKKLAVQSSHGAAAGSR